MEKKDLYIEKINLIAHSNIPNKHEELSKIYTEYLKYCYENNIKDEINIFEYGPLSYIIESKPLIFDVNEEHVENAFKHLEEVIKNNESGLIDGISLEEAETILHWNVQNARKSMAKNEANFENASLTGYCGFAQSMTLLPMIEMGLEVTINNVENFPQAKYRHAFGTVKIPIKENDKVYYKQFLLDASYRQYFTSVECSTGRFYLDNCTHSPSAGYYVCQTEEGKNMASTILKYGFIELTPQIAKLYGSGFSCESLSLETLEKQKEIMAIPENEFLYSINYLQEKELNNDKEELEEAGEIITPPGISRRSL